MTALMYAAEEGHADAVQADETGVGSCVWMGNPPGKYGLGL